MLYEVQFQRLRSPMFIEARNLSCVEVWVPRLLYCPVGDVTIFGMDSFLLDQPLAILPFYPARYVGTGTVFLDFGDLGYYRYWRDLTKDKKR